MRTTVEKLRTWIVLIAILLVVALVASLTYARYRLHQFGKDLPQKLGLEIQQSTNNFTISKSSKGRTLFVLHASKAVQYKNGGRAVLHDVSIEIYGTDGTSTDRISGSEFDYDPTTKIVRADGLVDIVLSDPRSQSAAKQSKSDAKGLSAQKSIHVKTTGLVFNQESQIATTTQALTFEQDASSGSARGATYNADKGTLVLANDVVFQTTLDGDPVSVKAQNATFDRSVRQMFLLHESVDFRKDHGTSDQGTIFFRPDGKTDHVTAEGHVHLTTEDGSDLRSADGTAQLDANGALQQIRLDGGLLLVSQGPVHSLHVDSTSGVLSFVPTHRGDSSKAGSTASQLNHIRLIGAVSAVDQQNGLRSDPRGSETRETRAGQLDVDVKADASGKVEPVRAFATGNADVTIHTIHSAAPQQVTKLKGDQLLSTIVDGHSISTLQATGNASLEQSTPGGLSQSSSGDSLMVTFAVNGSSPLPAPPHRTSRRGDHSGKPSTEGNQIESAVLNGHAMVVQQDSSAGGEKAVANADRITYQGSTGVMQLTGGNPHISKGQSDITAPAIEFNQITGDAAASGGVKASYSTNADRNDPAARPSGTSDVTHVVADHASLNHARDETTFFGGPHEAVRMWQGSNSIIAPTIMLSRSFQSLTADGGVKSTFVENTRPASSSQPRVVQTSSSSLTYSGGERKVTLSGGVTARSVDGTVTAATIELYLEPANKSTGVNPVSGTTTSAGPGGQVDRIVAEQNVHLTQGNRSGTGDKLVYTAEDGHFVLTGTGSTPPTITDREHGTVSGSSLIFNDRDDSVVVSRGQSPTTTDSHTKADPRKKDAAAGSRPAGTAQQ